MTLSGRACHGRPGSDPRVQVVVTSFALSRLLSGILALGSYDVTIKTEKCEILYPQGLY